MKEIFTAVYLLIIATAVIGQCNYAVPPSAVPYPWGTVHSSNNDTVFACGNKQLEITGQNNLILVDFNVGLTLSNNYNHVVMRSPGLLEIESDSNLVYVESGVTVVDSGIGNEIHTCPSSPLYDFTNAPSNMCNYPVAIEEKTYDEYILVSPNPSNGDFTITFDDIQIIQINIFSLDGRMIRNTSFIQNEGRISFQLIEPPGSYNLIIQTDKGLISRNITIL